MTKPVYQNYILLPKLGVRFSEESPDSETQEAFSRLKIHTRLDDVLDHNLTDRAVVLDTSGRRGAKLIRLPEADLPDLRSQLPGLRIVPEVFYYSQRWQQEVRRKPRFLAGQPRAGIRIRLVEARTNRPVADAVVVAFTDFAEREGEQATSDAQGVVRFRNISSRPLDQIFVYPRVGYWSFWKQNITLNNDDAIPLQPVRLDYKDAKNFFIQRRPEAARRVGA